MINSPELKDLKVGDRIEGWCPKSRCWVRVSVTSIATKSFQGVDKEFQKWVGLTKWREPEEKGEWKQSKLGEYRELTLPILIDSPEPQESKKCLYHEPRNTWNDSVEYVRSCSYCRQSEPIDDVEELGKELAGLKRILTDYQEGFDRAKSKGRKKEFDLGIRSKNKQIQYIENLLKTLNKVDSPEPKQCCDHLLIDGCQSCGLFTTIPWNERHDWNEPLDPDDVWKVGDQVQWRKGLQQFGTVRGLRHQELLGGKLPLIIVRWDGGASDVLIPPNELWRIWEDQEQPKIDSPEPRKRSPKGTRKYQGRCDKGQTNPSGRIERQTKKKKLSSGETKVYEYNLYRYQLGGGGKVYSKVIPSGKLLEVAEAIAAGHPAEIIVSWFWR
ncbi:hypothetical protein [Coleofasciculus sp. FACHB-501]|uniref:hypothetical protein n=1 Tax=Cyanophyceae TaxID=3028117 RepID=UPI001686B1A5|nr:hypothetical protein [Coleofasciculus sp. FACHB-501]MBD1836660.1 hypothetical protein [Coleofasciculus sp. FACHB-501]